MTGLGLKLRTAIIDDACCHRDALWGEERCTHGTSFCGKALARAAAQLCRHRRLRWRAVVAQTGLAVQATAVA